MLLQTQPVPASRIAYYSLTEPTRLLSPLTYMFFENTFWLYKPYLLIIVKVDDSVSALLCAIVQMNSLIV